MKFSQVIFLFSALFALSYALPYDMDGVDVAENADDELFTSNDPVEKRFTVDILKSAVSALCSADNQLNDMNVEKACECARDLGILTVGPVPPEKRFFFDGKPIDPVEIAKTAINTACIFVQSIPPFGKVCTCLKRFI